MYLLLALILFITLLKALKLSLMNLFSFTFELSGDAKFTSANFPLKLAPSIPIQKIVWLLG